MGYFLNKHFRILVNIQILPNDERFWFVPLYILYQAEIYPNLVNIIWNFFINTHTTSHINFNLLESYVAYLFQIHWVTCIFDKNILFVERQELSVRNLENLKIKMKYHFIRIQRTRETVPGLWYIWGHQTPPS